VQTLKTGLRTLGTPGILADNGRVVGFGDDGLQVRVIPRPQAVDTIRRHHYSGRVVNNSYIHLGVFWAGAFSGALQFGYALNPSSGRRTVADTGNREYLELNRMWIESSVPRNGESKSISYAVKLIKQLYPQVGWIQSFADERCGRFGVVYQASNFLYLGSHKTTFYRLDDQWYHEMLLTAHRKGGTRGQYLRSNIDRAESGVFRQFHYIYFIKQSARQRLLRPVLPYPKPETALHANNQTSRETGGKP